MLRNTLALLMALLVAPMVQGQDDAKKASPADQYQALVNQFRQAQQDLSKTYRAAETKEEQLKIRAKMNTIGVEYTPRFMELAKKHSKDPVAFDALSWIVTGASRFGGKGAGEALELLATNHLDDERMAQVSERLRYSTLKGASSLLETVLATSPHRDAQGQACYSLAFKLTRLKSADPVIQARAEQLYERITKDYGDVVTRNSTLGAVAKAALFEIRNLGIGKTAPEITAKDLDGVEFKLSDYRGKVVVIDFWGHW
jgi:hypothetical protein